MSQRSEANEQQYHLKDSGDFIIADYNSTKPFSSFFPGIAGVDGIPMWAFYVNRGQGVCSMGVQDKNHPIMEFQPANAAYDVVTRRGFRTFIRLSGKAPIAFYEPFQNHYRDDGMDRAQRMIISPSRLTLEEENRSLDLKFTVEYFTVPQDNYAGLVRTLHIENLGNEPVTFDGLDGLPVIVPYGVDNFFLKNMRRTIEAFVEVCNVENGAPFFRAKVEPADRPDVARIMQGNFYVAFEIDRSAARQLDPVYDPARIFGRQTDLSYPDTFLSSGLADCTRDQIREGRLPCAMATFSSTIPAGGRYTCVSIIGHVSSIAALNELTPRICSADYVREKVREDQRIISELTQTNLVCSREPSLDHYVRQNFLDNAMRGGIPYTFTGKESPATLYLFSRKHGDLERDYNDFRLTPTFYSQGNGNFRDINQNRRSDLLFKPEIGDDNVVYFYNLLQLDGYNPLVLKEMRFGVADWAGVRNVLERFFDPEQVRIIEDFLEAPFTPGSLLMFLNNRRINLRAGTVAFLGEFLEHCTANPDVAHGEGYWIDHWTYNLDLLENYLAVYPDRFKQLLFQSDCFTFHNSAHRVQGRNKRYVLWKGRPMQLGSVVLDEEKAKLLRDLGNKVRVDFGKGNVYCTSLFVKLLCTLVNKLASLDPEGIGVEMEAGKPGWYDALNGLPGQFGSSTCETLEIKRHIQFLLDRITEHETDLEHFSVFEEMSDFMETLHDLLQSNLPPIEYWDRSSTAKEEYRERTRLGISGKEIPIQVNKIKDFFEAALKKLNAGIEKAWDPATETLFTYFRHDVTDYEAIEIPEVFDDAGAAEPRRRVPIKPRKFRQVPLPLFLEGPVHYLRCLPGTDKARTLAANIQKSDLYDRSLKMYKVNASLADEPMEIGRARVFSPGWLENESIWLHMEYKYILELLRNGLYEEFYDDFRRVAVPFLNPEIYGRSILENSSFLASSAHPDSSIHGNGFVARLSGATAEFIHMLLLMATGPRPFRLSGTGELELCLKPSLPSWLFTREARTVCLVNDGSPDEIELSANTFSFMFLGSILVTFHNPDLKDTFGKSAVKPVEWKVFHADGSTRLFDTETIKGHIVGDIRKREVTRIDITLR